MGTRYKRPEGTDGTDHEYREQIDDTYKALPVWRAAAWMSLHLSFIPLAGKVAIAFIPTYIDGSLPHFQTASIIALYIIALILWKLAKPATYKESLTLTKLTNVCVMLAALMHFLEMYRYHTMLPKHTLYPPRLAQFLKEEKGGVWEQAHWTGTFTTIEACIEAFAFIFLGGAAVCFHNYITRKMMIEKKKEQAKKRKDVQAKKDTEGKDEGEVKALPAAAPREGSARKRPGRA